jgi:hypothetical protein
MSSIVIVTLIYHRHKSMDSINLLGSEWRRNVFAVRDEHPLRALSKRQDEG